MRGLVSRRLLFAALATSALMASPAVAAAGRTAPLATQPAPAAPAAAVANAPGIAEVPNGVTLDGWSSPLRVVSGGFDAVSEVVDSTNHVHIAATGRGGVWYMTDRSGAWTRKKILANTGSFSYVQPSIALDTNDRVFIAVLRVPNAEGDLGIWYVTDKGRTRGTFATSPTRIAPAGNGMPSLKVSGGHLFLADVRGWCCVGDGQVQLRTNVTGHWTVATLGRGENPSLRIGSDGHPRVTFGRGDESMGIYYSVASSASGGFTTKKIPGTNASDVMPLLALDTSNRAHIAWAHQGSSSTAFRYIWQVASGWHAPLTAVGNRPYSDSMGFDLDTQGRPNVVVGGSSVHDEILMGGSWHQSTVATSTDVGQIVVRRAFNGHTVIVWTDTGGVFVSRN